MSKSYISCLTGWVNKQGKIFNEEMLDCSVPLVWICHLIYNIFSVSWIIPQQKALKKSKKKKNAICNFIFWSYLDLDKCL